MVGLERPIDFRLQPLHQPRLILTTTFPTQPLNSEAAWGIRSFADAPINASALDVSGAPPFSTNRDCGRSVAHTNDAAFVLDCAAEYARESLRQLRALPLDEFELGEVFSHYDPEPSLSDEPPDRAGPACEDMVDEAPRSCNELVAVGHCVASCSPFLRDRLGRQDGNGHSPARSVIASYSATAAAGTCSGANAHPSRTHDSSH